MFLLFFGGCVGLVSVWLDWSEEIKQCVQLKLNNLIAKLLEHAKRINYTWNDNMEGLPPGSNSEVPF